VSLAAIVKAGAVADPVGKEGLASVTQDCCARHRQAKRAEVCEDLDFIGGSFAADAGADFTSISGEFLTKDWIRVGSVFRCVATPCVVQARWTKCLRRILTA